MDGYLHEPNHAIRSPLIPPSLLVCSSIVYLCTYYCLVDSQVLVASLAPEPRGKLLEVATSSNPLLLEGR